jgi:serine protein kinase
MGIFEQYKDRYEAHKEEEFTIQEFLEICKNDPTSYANSAERLLNAIGTPQMLDTSQDPTLSRIFSNRVIARYPAFAEFYGIRWRG